jgi:hypothetical protein
MGKMMEKRIKMIRGAIVFATVGVVVRDIKSN